MPKEESAYHMKRCIDSGLWVPDAKAAGQSCTYALQSCDLQPIRSAHVLHVAFLSMCKCWSGPIGLIMRKFACLI